LVVGDCVPLDPPHEIEWRVAGERRATEVGVPGQEALRGGVEGREVAAPSAGDRDLSPERGIPLEQQYGPAPPAGFDRAKEAGGAAADDDRVQYSLRRPHADC